MAKRSPGGNKGTISLFVVVFLLGVSYVVWLAAGLPDEEEPTATVSATVSAAVSAATNAPFSGPTRTLRPTRTPRAPQASEARPSPTPLARRLKVGIVAGHWQSDTGAVCPDGLEEVSINLDVASRVVAMLQNRGYDAELLPEFAGKLNGYRADAFVSIHADSCEVPGVSGFKVARVAASAIPEEDDRLVACLIEEYGQATDLLFHIDSITFDMTDYHAFKEIHAKTPAAIIELGFMDADRALLTDQSSEVAEAVVQGIVCFLEGE